MCGNCGYSHKMIFVARNHIYCNGTNYVAIGSIHCNTRQSVTGAQKSVTNYRPYHNMGVLLHLKKSVITDNHGNTRQMFQ
jgi:hypothetical protein